MSQRFPACEAFGLTAQIRRAVVSVASNIAEGARRKRRRVFLHHLDVALGSQGEADAQLEIAVRLGYLSKTDHDRVAERTSRVGRMLNGLINSLQVRPADFER